MSLTSAEELFAHDLMRFVMNEHNLRWHSLSSVDFHRQEGTTTFAPIVGQAVYELSFLKIIFQKKQILNLLRRETVKGQNFEELVKNVSSACFSEGFSTWNFLKFCSYVTATAVEYYKCEVTYVPDQASEVIAEVLRDNDAGFLAVGSWTSLYQESAKILESDILVKRGCSTCCCI